MPVIASPAVAVVATVEPALSPAAARPPTVSPVTEPPVAAEYVSPATTSADA